MISVLHILQYFAVTIVHLYSIIKSINSLIIIAMKNVCKMYALMSFFILLTLTPHSSADADGSNP